jgi:hypothetical protein
MIVVTLVTWVIMSAEPQPDHKRLQIGALLGVSTGIGFIALFWYKGRAMERRGMKGRPTVTPRSPKGALPTRVGTVLRGADYDALRRETAARKKSQGKISSCPTCGKPVLLGAPVCRWCGGEPA